MKSHLVYSLLILSLLTASGFASYDPDNEATAQDSGNPYSSDKKVKHSLFLDKNLWDRISGGEQGVPMKNASADQKNFENPESLTAYKIAKYYRNIFEFLDEDVDDLLTQADIERVYKTYNWPMPNDVSIEDYVKDKFKMFDTRHENHLDFIQFCHFMEDVWRFAEYDRQKNSISALRQAINVFDRLFEYLDNDRDGFIDKRNVKFGVSFVTNKNIDSDDVDRAFETYDTDKDGKLNKKEFILASMNDGFLRSVENPSITSSFFNN